MAAGQGYTDPQTGIYYFGEDDLVTDDAGQSSFSELLNKGSRGLAAALTTKLPGLATAALTTAINTLALVKGVTFTDTEYAIPFADQDGYAAGGITKDGSAKFVRLLHAAKSIPVTAMDTTFPITAVPSERGWAIPFTDNEDYVAGGWLPDGTFSSVNGIQFSAADAVNLAQRMLTLTKSSKTKLCTVGDSQTRGFAGGNDWTYAEAWPGQMAAILPPTVTVLNIAESGRTVDELAIKFGAIQLVAQASLTIPAAATAAAVTVQAGIGWIPNAARTFTGSFTGIDAVTGLSVSVPGTLSRTGADTTAVTFTRTTAGNDVAVPAAAVFVSDFSAHRDETISVMLGRNDVSNNVKGGEASVAEHVVATVKKIHEYLTPQVKAVVFLGVLTATNETTGTAGYNTIVSINSQLAVAYPGRYLDLRNYLVTQAIYDLGIAPTATDLSRIAGDTLPPSIMVAGDSIHFSKATATLIGLLIGRWLIARNWV